MHFPIKSQENPIRKLLPFSPSIKKLSTGGFKFTSPWEYQDNLEFEETDLLCGYAGRNPTHRGKGSAYKRKKNGKQSNQTETITDRTYTHNTQRRRVEKRKIDQTKPTMDWNVEDGGEFRRSEQVLKY